MATRSRVLFFTTLMGVLLSLGCSGPSTGQSCSEDGDCLDGQSCITEFKGGVCGIDDCESDEDCPDDAICVKHDGNEYCFLKCTDKSQCNAQRGPDEEANCSSNIERLGDSNEKACIPPSGD